MAFAQAHFWAGELWHVVVHGHGPAVLVNVGSFEDITFSSSLSSVVKAIVL